MWRHAVLPYTSIIAYSTYLGVLWSSLQRQRYIMQCPNFQTTLMSRRPTHPRIWEIFPNAIRLEETRGWRSSFTLLSRVGSQYFHVIATTSSTRFLLLIFSSLSAMARLTFKAQNPLNAILMVFIVYFSLTYHWLLPSLQGLGLTASEFGVPVPEPL